MEPTHHSQLDPKTMSVGALRVELKARNINSKGLKSQLVAKLVKALKAEADKTDEETKEESQSEMEVESLDDKKTDVSQVNLPLELFPSISSIFLNPSEDSIHIFGF